MVIVLDTFPTGSVSKRPGKKRPTVSDACHQWVLACEAAGHRVLIPAISYYEVLRELEQRQATGQIARLKEFCLRPHRFLSITTAHLETAAQLWGRSRRTGLPAADPQALDGDVILAAQALSLGVPEPGIIVATTNPAHISRYIAADLWTNIQP